MDGLAIADGGGHERMLVARRIGGLVEMGQARPLLPEGRRIQFRGEIPAVGVALYARPVEIVGLQRIAEGGRPVAEIEQCLSRAGVHEFVVDVGQAAVEDVSVQIHPDIHGSGEAEPMPDLVEDDGYKVVLGERRVAIESVIPVGPAVEVGHDVRRTRIQIRSGEFVRQRRGIQHSGEGSAAEIVPQARGTRRTQSVARQVFPSRIDHDRHIGSDESGPDVDGVLECCLSLGREARVVHDEFRRPILGSHGGWGRDM